jgi:tRNA(fMet)-specific endonuclease VapC
VKQFLLDTDTCIFALKRKHGVAERMVAHARASIHLSVITVAELRAGAAKSASPAKTTRLLESFLAPLDVLDFTAEDAHRYGQVRTKLEKAGKPIGPLDTLIASHAVARGFILVTNNTAEFKRVPDLALENWAS